MADIIETCFHHNVFAECKFCYPIYERGKSDGIREGMERAAGIARQVSPRHTECGNKIAHAIQSAEKEIK